VRTGGLAGSGLLRIDRNPYRKGWLSATANVGINTFYGAGAGPLTLAERTADRTLSDYFGQITKFLDIGRSGLLVFRGSVAGQRDHTSVDAQNGLEGRVLVADPTVGTRVIAFGPRLSTGQNTTRRTSELQADYDWYGQPGANERRHRRRLILRVRDDNLTLRSVATTSAVASFGSLQALQLNLAERLQVTNRPAARILGQTAMALGFAESWSATPKLRLSLGGRADLIQQPTDRVRVNANEVRESSAPPLSANLSPRVGLTWDFGDPKRRPFRRTESTVGGFFTRPSGQLRVGAARLIGLYDLAEVATSGVAAGGVQRRTDCVGAAVPSVNWRQTVSATLGCVPATSTLIFTDSLGLGRRAEQALDTWRGNAGIYMPVGKLDVFVELLATRTAGLVDAVDVNRRASPAFTNAADGRPVWSPATVIASTGATPLSGSRSALERGVPVLVDGVGRARTQQLTVGVQSQAPGVFQGSFWSLAYTLANSAEQRRGIRVPTFADASQSLWAPANRDVRHQLIAQGARVSVRGNVSGILRVSSGRPFSALMLGDPNADGWSNDLASTSDVRSQRLRGGIFGVSCTVPAASATVERNGCRMPATVDLTLQATTQAARLVRRLPGTVTLAMSNVLALGQGLSSPSGALARLLPDARPDPVASSVTGFSATNGFATTPNPTFGRVDIGSSPGRSFLATLEWRIDLSEDRSVQMAKQFLSPGRAQRGVPRLSADEIARRYAATVPDPYREIEGLADSLALDSRQIAALRVARPLYRQQIEPLWQAAADSLAKLPNGFDARVAARMVDDAADRVWQVTVKQQGTLKVLLDDAQVRLLPRVLQSLVKDANPLRVRTFSF
jgi:hypothetical protein